MPASADGRARRGTGCPRSDFAAARPAERRGGCIEVGPAAAQVLSETAARDIEFRLGVFDDPRLAVERWGWGG